MIFLKEKVILISSILLTAFIFCSQVHAESSPYAISQYKPVLNQVKLQAPTSVDLINQGDFLGKYNKYFYIDKATGWMSFTVTGDHHRSELRQISDWKTSDLDYSHQMIGQAVVYKPKEGKVNEITFMQIHDVTDNKNSINKPLLRLVWLRSRHGIKNHYWAVVKEDACRTCKNYMKVDLGGHSISPIKFDVNVVNNLLTLTVNGKIVPSLNKYNISYWAGLRSYFKSGVYNQSPGTATVKFKSLDFYKNKIIKN
ncbi:polysaccharide lyase family 7 protein [Marinomonas sp. TI.3.20]|uniref:polysaccharide lyase family 7 protein n=1 Tax=Marinomonas sp. TI.3.20 TaxID=3121296 RepID=UPI00311D8A55